MAAVPKPTFEEACNRFRKFLSATKWPEEFVWLRPDDVLVTSQRFFFVKSPASASNQAHYRKQFETGMERELGVEIQALSKSKAKTYCFVWTPTDEDESTRYMMPITGDYLKMSIPTRRSMLLAKEIRSDICWLYLKFKHKSKQKLRHQLFFLGET
jgi:hypothetical protein